MLIKLPNTLELHYEDLGKGLPLLLIHGSFSRGDEAFSTIAPLLAEQYRVLIPDLRGHGRSHCSAPDWDTPRLAQDMLDLLGALHLERAHILGHSMGGDVAMSAAVQAPDCFLSLVSIGSGGSPNPALERYLAKLGPEHDERNRRSPFVAHIKKQHHAAHGGDWRAFFRATIENCMRYPAFTETDLARLNMPFLLLHGEHDPHVEQKEWERLEQHCPYFSHRMIPGAGHSPQNSHAHMAETARLVLDFLQSVA